MDLDSKLKLEKKNFIKEVTIQDLENLNRRKNLSRLENETE